MRTNTINQSIRRLLLGEVVAAMAAPPEATFRQVRSGSLMKRQVKEKGRENAKRKRKKRMNGEAVVIIL